MGQDFRRIWEEESGVNRAKKEAEAKVPSLLTESARMKKEARDGGSGAGGRGGGGGVSKSTPNRNNLFKPSSTKQPPANGGSMKLTATQPEMDDDILAGYGAKRAPERLSSEKTTLNRQSGAGGGNVLDRVTALFGKGPTKRKMSLGGVKGWKKEEDDDDADYENGHLFKRAKLDLGYDGEADKKPVTKSTFTKQLSPPPSQTPTHDEHQSAGTTSSQPTPPSSQAPSLDSTHDESPPPIIATPTQPSKNPVLFRKVNSVRKATWDELSAASPKPEVEVRSRFFHPPPPLKTPTREECKEEIEDDGDEEKESARMSSSASPRQNGTSDASPACRTPRGRSLFAWNVPFKSPSTSSSPRPASPNLGGFSDQDSGRDSAVSVHNSPAVSKPFRSVVARKEEEGGVRDVGGDEGHVAESVDVVEGKEEVKRETGSVTGKTGQVADDARKATKNIDSEDSKQSLVFQSGSSQKENNAEDSPSRPESFAKNSTRSPFFNSPKVSSQFSNPLKKTSTLAKKNKGSGAAIPITSFFAKKS